MLERRRSKQVTDENPDDDPFVIVKYCGRYAITGEIAYTNSTINIYEIRCRGEEDHLKSISRNVEIICTSDFCANKHIFIPRHAYIPRTSTLLILILILAHEL